MRSWMAIAALVLAGASGDTRVVRNHARILAEPHYWARHVGDVDRGQPLGVLKQEGAWFKVQLKSRGVTGYVPQSAFVDAAVTDAMLAATQTDERREARTSQVANASRGFSTEAHAADVSKANLKEADAWIAKYEGAQNGAKLEQQLASDMPRFLADGQLAGGAE